jgi:type I restriction enzyme S subunit
MRDGWVNKSLGEVCVKTKNIKWQDHEGREFQYVDLSSVSRETLEVTDTAIVTNETAPSRAKKIIEIGDVIFATTRPTLKRATIINENLDGQICSTGYVVLRPNHQVSSEWVFFYLLTSTFMDRMESLQRGASYPAVTDSDVKGSLIAVPPLPEQQQIVAILDQAFEAIDQAKANIEKNIENAKELFQSKLNDIFSQKGEGWDIKFFGDIFNFRQGIQRGVKLQSETKQEGQVRFVRIVDYTQGNELPRYIDNPGEQYILDEKDISLVRYGASTGFVCRGIKGALANNLFRVIPKGKWDINFDFLYFFLNSPVFQRFIKNKMSGAAMPAISFGMISKIPFPITSIENQIDLSQKISELEVQTNNIIETYQVKLNNLEELKKSILQKAFVGELTNKALTV